MQAAGAVLQEMGEGLFEARGEMRVATFDAP